MEQDTLSQKLELLRQELVQAREEGADDAELAQLYNEALALIEAAPTTPEEEASLRQQLDDALPRFEAAHPTLTMAISQVIDTLNRMGL